VSQKNSRPSRGGLTWNRAGRAIVWLRLLIVPAWIAATVVAVAHLPSAFDAEAGELGSLLPHSAEALEVERQAIETFGLPLLSHTMVVARQPQGFSAAQTTAAALHRRGRPEPRTAFGEGRAAPRGRARSRERGTAGEGDRGPAGNKVGNRDRRKPFDLGRAGDRAARGGDPCFLLSLSGGTAAPIGDGGGRLPLRRPDPRLDRRALRPLDSRARPSP
jgi:hypothetical protein